LIDDVKRAAAAQTTAQVSTERIGQSGTPISDVVIDTCKGMVTAAKS